jgi:hypothetical protein
MRKNTGQLRDYGNICFNHGQNEVNTSNPAGKMMSGRVGGARDDKPAKDDKQKPVPAPPRPDDDEEDGDIATPKRDRDDEDI